MSRRERERDGAAERMSDDRRASEVEPREEIGDDFRECSHVVGESPLRRLLALAETRKVRGHELELRRYLVHDRVPGASMQEEPVEQDHGGAFARDSNAKTYPVGLDVALGTRPCHP